MEDQYFLKVFIYNLGILFVSDLIDENGNVHVFDYVKNVLKAEITFLECMCIKS